MDAPSPDFDASLSAPGSMPRRRAALLHADLGDERVVYDPDRRHSFRLNRTAGLLLDRCDGQSLVGDVVAELAQAFAVDLEQVAAQLERTLATFVADGLVEDPNGGDRALTSELDRVWGPPPRVGGSAPAPVGGSAPAPVGSPVPAPEVDVNLADQPGERERDDHLAGPWRRVLDLLVRLRAEDPSLTAELDRVFGSLPEGPEPQQSQPHQRRYHLSWAGADSIDVELDGHRVGRANSPDAAVSFTQWHLNREAVAGVVDRVLLHAGAVRLRGGLVVLPGESNAGKSTLVAGLVRAGGGYLTDELIGLTPGTNLATGYRKAISLDPGSWPLFPEVEPASSGPRREWLIEPTDLHPNALDGEDFGEVSLVVFPRFEAGAVTEAESLSPAQALVELIRHDPAADPMDAAAFDTLAELARRTPAFRLTTGDLHPAVARVLTLAGPAQLTGSDS